VDVEHPGEEKDDMSFSSEEFCGAVYEALATVA
jgi:hypothetical protein